MEIFNAIDNLEDLIYSNGIKEGKSVGERKLYEDGFNFGWHQASHILQELGLIVGFLHSLLFNNCPFDEKNKKAIIKLINLIRKCCEWNSNDEEELEQKLNVIHTNMKMILRKLNVTYKVIDFQLDSEF